MQNSWAAPGVECVCIARDWGYGGQDTFFIILPPSFPQFMQQYTILDVQAMSCGAKDCKGDHVMIALTVIPDFWFTIDGFAPIQKIEDEQKLDTRVPEHV